MRMRARRNKTCLKFIFEIDIFLLLSIIKRNLQCDRSSRNACRDSQS